MADARRDDIKAHLDTGRRPQVLADLRAAVKRTLGRCGVGAADLDPITARRVEQATHTFTHWPLLAV